MTPANALRAARRASVLAAILVPALAAPAQAALPDRIVGVARAELAKKVHETPNGSNESAGIARYRKAVRWSSPRTPWCGYFVSYVALKAGAPLGDSGEGIGSVTEIRRWAKRTKRWRAKPHRGNIAVFRGHVGIVELVVGSRWVVTIEGNHSNRVARVWRSRSEIRGFVRLKTVPKPKAPVSEEPTPSDEETPEDDSGLEPPQAGDDPGLGDDENLLEDEPLDELP